MRYFFFGTLLDPEVRRAVLGAPAAAALHARPAVLPGHRPVYAPGHSYPTLERAEDAQAVGAVFDGVSPASGRVLAEYEGPEYVAREIRVQLLNGPELAARVFLAASPVPAGQPEWRFEAWRVRHRARFLARLRSRGGEASAADGAGSGRRRTGRP